MEKNLFRSFKYEVGDFTSDQRKVKVFFVYKEEYNIVLSLMIRKSNFHNDEKYYVLKLQKDKQKLIDTPENFKITKIEAGYILNSYVELSLAAFNKQMNKIKSLYSSTL